MRVTGSKKSKSAPGRKLPKPGTDAAAELGPLNRLPIPKAAEILLASFAGRDFNTAPSESQRQAAELLSAGLDQADQRIGRTWIQQLQWLLEFVQRERIEVVRELSQDNPALLWEAIWFSQDANLTGLADPSWILAAFDSLKSATASFIERGSATLEVEKVTFVLFNRRTAGRKGGREVEVFHRSTDPATRFILAAYRLLELEGKRVARCDAPQCGRLYIRQKRAIFCSKRCSQREQARRWRDRHPGLQQQRQREYYERKLRKRISGINGRKKVAVIVRPRKRTRKDQNEKS
jgi:hypothetical protein